MGRFLSTQELTARFGEAEMLQVAGTGDWNTPEGRTVDAEAVEREIAFADEIVGGHVLQRHPWVAGRASGEVPDLLKGLAADIVRYRLRDRAGSSSAMTQTVKDRHDAAMKALTGLSKGTMDLVDDAQGESAPSGAGDAVRMTGPGRVMPALVADYLA